MQHHAESCGNYVEKLFLDPKGYNLNKKLEFCRVPTCPSVPKAPIEGEILQNKIIFVKTAKSVF